MKEEKFKSPRINQGEGAKNPFTDELGVQKAKDSDESIGTFTDTGSGWMPIMGSDKTIKRLSLWDNSQTPGYKDNQQGSPFMGMGEPPMQTSTDYDSLTSTEEKGFKKTPEELTRIDKKDENPQGKVNQFYLEDQRLTRIQEKKMDWKKFAANREKRLESIYSLEDDYTAYGRYCGKDTCVGVWKELLGFDQKRDLGLERESEVWKCPRCNEVTSAKGSISEQTSGFSAYDTFSNSQSPISKKDGFEPVDSIESDKDRTKR